MGRTTVTKQALENVYITDETRAFFEAFGILQVSSQVKDERACVCVIDAGFLPPALKGAFPDAETLYDLVEAVQAVNAVAQAAADVAAAFASMDPAQLAAIATLLIDPDVTNTVVLGPNNLIYEND